MNINTDLRMQFWLFCVLNVWKSTMKNKYKITVFAVLIFVSCSKGGSVYNKIDGLLISDPIKDNRCDLQPLNYKGRPYEAARLSYNSNVYKNIDVIEDLSRPIPPLSELKKLSQDEVNEAFKETLIRMKDTKRPGVLLVSEFVGKWGHPEPYLSKSDYLKKSNTNDVGVEILFRFQFYPEDAVVSGVGYKCLEKPYYTYWKNKNGEIYIDKAGKYYFKEDYSEDSLDAYVPLNVSKMSMLTSKEAKPFFDGTLLVTDEKPYCGFMSCDNNSTYQFNDNKTKKEPKNYNTLSSKNVNLNKLKDSNYEIAKWHKSELNDPYVFIGDYTKTKIYVDDRGFVFYSVIADQIPIADTVVPERQWGIKKLGSLSHVRVYRIMR